MYVPSVKLLLKYTDLTAFKTIIHRTNFITDGANAEIKDEDNLTYNVRIKKWKAFLDNREEFLKDLDYKIKNSERNL